MWGKSLSSFLCMEIASCSKTNSWMDYPVPQWNALAPLSKMNWTHRTNYIYIRITSGLSILYVPLICMSIHMPVPQCLDICCYVVSFKIRKCEFFKFVLFQNRLNCSRCFVLPNKFHDLLVHICRKACCNLIGIILNNYGKNCHVNYILSSSPLSTKCFSFIFLIFWSGKFYSFLYISFSLALFITMYFIHRELSITVIKKKKRYHCFVHEACYHSFNLVYPSNLLFSQFMNLCKHFL